MEREKKMESKRERVRDRARERERVGKLRRPAGMKNVSCQDLKERERKNKSLLECISITTGCYESVLSYFFPLPFVYAFGSISSLYNFFPPQIFSLSLRSLSLSLRSLSHSSSQLCNDHEWFG